MPGRLDPVRAQEYTDRGLVTTIVHVASNLFHEFVKRPGRLAKHRKLLMRLRQMRGEQNIPATRDFFTMTKQVWGRRKQCVRRQSPILLRFQLSNSKLDNFIYVIGNAK